MRNILYKYALLILCLCQSLSAKATPDNLFTPFADLIPDLQRYCVTHISDLSTLKNLRLTNKFLANAAWTVMARHPKALWRPTRAHGLASSTEDFENLQTSPLRRLDLSAPSTYKVVFLPINAITFYPHSRLSQRLELLLIANHNFDLSAFLPLQLMNLTALTTLNLTGNNVRDEGASYLSKLPALINLHLSWNEVTDQGVIALCQNTRLKTLVLAENIITPVGAKLLAQHKALTQLDLSHNMVGLEGATALAHNQTLTWLNLRDNDIETQGAEAFAHNHSLKTLDLSWNQIQDTGVHHLGQNTTLLALDLSGNRLGNDVMTSLAANTCLQILNLKETDITGEAVTSLCQMHGLTSLYISNHMFSKAAENTLRDRMPRLRTLYLGDNFKLLFDPLFTIARY